MSTSEITTSVFAYKAVFARLAALIAGLMFGTGLALSGMTDPAVVQAFLDVFGDWDLRLAFVMAGALAITVPSFQFILKRLVRQPELKPILAEHFELPHTQSIDARLVLGALLFGAGWGLYGYCPGPAIAALAYGTIETVTFVLVMALGMLVAEYVNNRLAV